MCNGAYWSHEEFIQDENGFWQLLGQLLEKEDRDRECTCGSVETWTNCTANTQKCG